MILSNLKNVLILPNKKVADYFIKELYSYNTNYIILTLDESYPSDGTLRKEIWTKIETDETLIVLMIGVTHLSKLKTKNVTILDRFLEMDALDKGDPTMHFPSEDYHKNLRFNFTKQNFLNLIFILFMVLKSKKGGRNNNERQRNFLSPYKIDYKKNIIESDWKHVLLENCEPAHYICKEISYEQISQAWNKLWPGRDAKPTNPWDLTDDYNIQEQGAVLGKPTFFGVYNGDELIGVNSGYKTSTSKYRSRGLWVDENYRRRSISTLLLNNTITQARHELLGRGLPCLIWTCPREESFRAYEKSGFNIVRNGLGKPLFDWGINYIAIKEL